MCLGLTCGQIAALWRGGNQEAAPYFMARYGSKQDCCKVVLEVCRQDGPYSADCFVRELEKQLALLEENARISVA
jgi:hypothetical protein